ncbi:MAG: endonuclease MutS2 [Calditrichia bacterium]
MENRIQQLLSDENLVQLELPSLLQKLRKLVATPYGHPHMDGLSLDENLKTVEKMLQEVTEMVGLMQGGYSIPIGEMDDIRPLLEKLQPENAFLEPPELNQVKSNLQGYDEIARFFIDRKEDTPLLGHYAGRIHSHRAIVKEIEHSIDHHGEMREDASPELRRIRIEIGRLENEQKTVLNRVLKRYSEFSQDDIVTLRDGRMVLGIQQHHVNRVNGIVHGTSGTGATVFIEPMETLRLSNQIQNLKIDERKEIIRILQFLSGLVREVRHDIHYALENVGALDFILAKARLSMAMDAAAPQISEKPFLHLMNARHPLLLLKMGHQNVVPSTVTLGEDFHTLVITGPNAGGKTVTLKTIGLVVLMTRLGLHIPAHPDSIIPLLDRVLVDIGDRQSLEQDLSTFSAHIIRLQEILRQANTHSLVLVDEIGTGTDPREGSALAIAILKELTERKSLTIASTHHGELKAFAFATNEVENASMEFNLETLQPTYHLQVGIPGSSYAFEIARRYDLSELVLERARKIVGPDKGELENLILNLNERLQKVEEERRELSIRLSEAEGLRNLYQHEMERLQREKTDLRRKAAEEARKLLDDANAAIERTVAEIRQNQARRESIREAHQQIRQLQDQADQTLEETKPRFQRDQKLRQGDVVWIESLREEGELLSEPDSHHKAWVLVGNMRMNMDTAELKKISRKKAKSDYVFKRGRNEKSDELESGILPELDLRGKDSYEATHLTDKYLDQALEMGWEEVRIVHGKGTGVLRRVINEFLARDKRVEEKRLGKWGEGDTGVTVVKLKR